MKKFLFILFSLGIILYGGMAWAIPIQSYTSVVTGGTLIDFEGMGEGTFIGNQYAGVHFGQDDGGLPMIDELPALYGYGASSGSAVLTGSTSGGASFPTVAGLTVTFDTGQSAVESFFSDTSPLADYTFSAYDSSNNLLESFNLLSSDILPPGYSGGFFPTPGTVPLPGIYVGFARATSDIFSVQFGPSLTSGDAFAIDDLRYASAEPVPEPSTILLMGAGLLGLVGYNRKRFNKNS